MADTPQAGAQELASDIIELREFFVLPRVGSYGRTPVHVDPIQAALARGDWQVPTANDAATSTEGVSVSWRAAQAANDGWLRQTALRGGYAHASVDSPSERIAVLEATGHAMVYVNGVPRAGDPYRTEKTVLPVKLRAGANHFLFHVAQGELRARLIPPTGEVSIDLRDSTLPDLIVGEQGPRWMGALVINARDKPLQAGHITSVRAQSESITAAVGSIPPMSVRKIGVMIDGTVAADADPLDTTRVRLDLTERSPSGEPTLIATAAFDLAVVAADAPHTRSFVSQIDGSVQSYSLMPATDSEPAPGLIVSLHDTGVDAVTHLADYAPKSSAHVVAPGGRRPFGFDWQDWSAQDVFEAIEDLAKHLPVDGSRIWLTGSATGGHGVWQLGATHAGRWAALGPLNGWVSYKSYGRSLPTWNDSLPVQNILARGTKTLDTNSLVRNMTATGIYVGHDATAAVSVDESRKMRLQLAQFHPDFVYRERQSPAQAAPKRCCDWPEMIEFFRNRQLPAPEDVDQISFATFDPGKAAGRGWVEIAQQQQQLKMSHVALQRDRQRRRYEGTTGNVRALMIDLSDLSPGEPIEVVLDGDLLGLLPWPESSPPQLWCVRDGANWRPAQAPSPSMKLPERYGNFKSVFDHRALLVFGTSGTEEENQWAFSKARFDAEMFLARGGGALEIVPDAQFRAEDYVDRNVVLYGSADTNSAWPQLLSTSPVQVRRGSIRIGDRPELGDDLACLFVRPRPDSSTALVGVVSGTGPIGFRATNRIPYFVSGVVLPDLLVLGAKTLEVGPNELRVAGFFGPDWSLEQSEIAWRDVAL